MLSFGPSQYVPNRIEGAVSGTGLVLVKSFLIITKILKLFNDSISSGSRGFVPILNRINPEHVRGSTIGFRYIDRENFIAGFSC